MVSRYLTVSFLALSLSLSACSNESAEQATSEEGLSRTADAAPADEAHTESALAIENLAKAREFLAANAKRAGVTTTKSGLQYMVLAEGPTDGASPQASDIVDVHYVGTLTDGVEFDSSHARGAPARFPLNQVVSGWTEGVQLMSEGDKYRFFLPPELGYGERGGPGGGIGPNEALIFDVELLKVVNPEKNLAEAQAFLAQNAEKQGVKTTTSGLQYEVLASGAGGKSPTDANIVKVNYEGRLLDGSVFDSSFERGEPIEFPLARVIPGWVEGVQLMKEGDKFRFYIPPELAYGEGGTPGGPIGPNEALIFDVELLEVKE